jgi:hypothetical protein
MPLLVGPDALTAPPISHPPPVWAPPVGLFSPQSPSRVRWRLPQLRQSQCHLRMPPLPPCPLARQTVTSCRNALCKRRLLPVVAAPPPMPGAEGTVTNRAAPPSLRPHTV